MPGMAFSSICDPCDRLEFVPVRVRAGRQGARLWWMVDTSDTASVPDPVCVKEFETIAGWHGHVADAPLVANTGLSR